MTHKPPKKSLLGYFFSLNTNVIQHIKWRHFEVLLWLVTACWMPYACLMPYECNCWISFYCMCLVFVLLLKWFWCKAHRNNACSIDLISRCMDVTLLNMCFPWKMLNVTMKINFRSTVKGNNQSKKRPVQLWVNTSLLIFRLSLTDLKWVRTNLIISSWELNVSF